MNTVVVSMGCDLGHCPSGPTAGNKTREWMLADGRLVRSVSHPADRYGTIAEVRLDIWGRDGYTHDAFDSPYARGVSLEFASEWLAQHGAVEIADWSRAFDYIACIGQSWWSTRVDQRAAWICAWYALRGIGMPIAPCPRLRSLSYAEHLTQIHASRPQPVAPSSRIVGGTRRRRNARRRVNG